MNKNQGIRCLICGKHITPGPLCINCGSAFVTFQRAFGSDESLVFSALQFFEANALKDVPTTSSPTTGEKRCAKCGLVKPLSAFYIYKGRPNSYCRSCNSEYHSERYHRQQKQSS